LQLILVNSFYKSMIEKIKNRDGNFHRLKSMRVLL